MRPNPDSPLPSELVGEGKTVRTAHPSEAAGLFALLTEAFAETLLPFTVFRAPQASARIAELAELGRVRVVGEGEGFAFASPTHLDYLAVAESARGQGLGRILMDDFHAGKAETTLDVVADNPARRWYESLGYVAKNESVHARLALKNTGSPPEHWRAALADERTNGFAAVGHAGMRVGLLAGTALRLLDAGGRPIEEALAILALIGFAGRKEIVLMGIDETPRGYDAIQIVRSVRMRREG